LAKWFGQNILIPLVILQGKEGYLGNHRMSKTFDNINDAKSLFEKRFMGKCGVEWHERDNLDEVLLFGRFSVSSSSV
jgi:hypothetical protein